MVRTRLRRLPDGRLRPIEAGWFGVLTIAAGLIVLVLGANVLAGAITFATVLLYTGVYTPLKRHTSFATHARAVLGALPPMIRWAAARGTLNLEAWMLFVASLLYLELLRGSRCSPMMFADLGTPPHRRF